MNVIFQCWNQTNKKCHTGYGHTGGLFSILKKVMLSSILVLGSIKGTIPNVILWITSYCNSTCQVYLQSWGNAELSSYSHFPLMWPWYKEMTQSGCYSFMFHNRHHNTHPTRMWLVILIYFTPLTFMVMILICLFVFSLLLTARLLCCRIICTGRYNCQTIFSYRWV